MLFAGYLVETNKKSTTIRCYLSAIRAILADEKIQINEDRSLLNAITRACKLKNDTLLYKFPIHRNLLKTIVKTTRETLERKGQVYLSVLYQALFSTAYFGLFRIGELTKSPHVILAKNVNITNNKKKLMFLLRSSKTHSKGDLPQIVKISATERSCGQSYNCPFRILQNYIDLRPAIIKDSEQFFSFSKTEHL